MRLQELLTRIAGEVESAVDRARHDVARRRDGRRPVRFEPFLGFGTSERAWVHGRVVTHPPIGVSRETDTRWRNLVQMYRRLRSAEVPYARVRATWGGASIDVTADEEGFFRSWIVAAGPRPYAGPWQDVALELRSPAAAEPPGATATARVLVPPRSATLGVISDIDDTVLQTDAASLVRMARGVLFGSARTRLPFSGVSAFYRALRRGRRGDLNPLFYVSSSPWNLYDLLIEFFELERIPAGPLLLRDWGITRDELFPTRHAAHKRESIELILAAYPELPFILIGDSGQEDPEIYRDVVRRHGERIRAIYIRNVTGLERAQEIHELSREIVAAGSSLVLADDTLAAARHAAEHGWIDPQWLARVGAACREDEAGAPGTPVRRPGRKRDDTPSVTIAVERA